MKRLKYPYIVSISSTFCESVKLEIPADLECEILSETPEIYEVKVNYIGFIITIFLKKDSIYEAH